ncbi:MAG: hypothetical protein AB7G93_22950 [Bdellovibrionales bacterium]
MQFSERVGIREECPKCRADAHVCKNCAFYDPKVYNECREPQAEVIRERDRANRCDYFQPGSGGATAGPSQEDLLKAAEALFGNPKKK